MNEDDYVLATEAAGEYLRAVEISADADALATAHQQEEDARQTHTARSNAARPSSYGFTLHVERLPFRGPLSHSRTNDAMSMSGHVTAQHRKAQASRPAPRRMARYAVPP